MPRIATKICGLSTPATVDAALAGGAAWLGFVFFPKSPRDVAPAAAAALAARAPATVGRVAVLVDPDDEAIARALAAGMTALQLHGDEPPARLAALRRPGVELWKAVPVRDEADVAAAARYRGVVDRIVYDARTPAGTLPGGMGVRFDWTLLQGVRHPAPWLLSGGLDAAVLPDAVAVSGARAVDVSSGVEHAPGVKDVDKIAGFLQAAERL